MFSRLSRLLIFGLIGLTAIGITQPVLAVEEIGMRYIYTSYGYSNSQPFSRPSGLFYDAVRDELYVADTGNGQIVVLDKKGLAVARIRHSMVDKVRGERRNGEPRSIVVRKNGDILVADNQCDYLDVLDFQGRSIQKIYLGELVGKEKSKVVPRSLALDSAGNIYIGVSGNDKEILVLTPEYKLKSQMGVESGGESRSVTGIWVDKAGKIYVTYGMGVCVRVFAQDGKQLLSFGAHDNTGPEGFNLPAGLVTDNKDRIWVLDTIKSAVTVFNTQQTDQGMTQSYLTTRIGGGRGRAVGDLVYPSAIAGDGVTKVYVLESTGARVQAFELLPK